MGDAGRDAAFGFVCAAGAVVVVRALGVFFVEDAMRMHAVGVGSVVLEEDLDGVADLCAQNRSHQAEVLLLRRARLEMGECGVGVFAIDGLLVDAADVVGASFGKAPGDGVEFHPHGLIAA